MNSNKFTPRSILIRPVSHNSPAGWVGLIMGLIVHAASTFEEIAAWCDERQMPWIKMKWTNPNTVLVDEYCPDFSEYYPDPEEMIVYYAGVLKQQKAKYPSSQKLLFLEIDNARLLSQSKKMEKQIKSILGPKAHSTLTERGVFAEVLTTEEFITL